ncbi:hypothetical protein INT43_005095 [Umbelopsis isabellina]|uniref:Nucleotide diphosphatase n=1 Tax=Mortierella isabellina TaxID=91625 RepID=A0A8H7U8S1_MORIS|nr:hypothetical protein INT43_005095 [Umbelopsis isabellina]
MPKDIPLLPRGSSDRPPSYFSQNDSDEHRLTDSEEHDQLLSSTPEHEYGYTQASEQENLLGDNSTPAFLGNQSRTRRIVIFRLVIAMLLVAVFISFVSIFAPGHSAGYNPSATFFNGSHTFDATVIMVSLDGFRADYLDRNITPALHRLANEGIQAPYMNPCFPSVTFSNHWSLVTGLYPESHGIVGNEFSDPDLNDTFYYKDPARSWDSKWWFGEPIWATTVLQNKKSAVMMWPGSDTKIENTFATYHIPYSTNYTTFQKAETILNWIDLPRDQRPQMMNMYIPQVDSAGHAQGPNGKRVNETLVDMDKTIEHLIAGLEERNLYDHVHLVIVSDHGMAESNRNRLIYWDDIVPKDLMAELEEREVWPLLALRPRATAPSDTISKIYSHLLNFTQQPDNTPDKSGPQSHFQVYLRENIPEHLHYRNSHRIAPILGIPDVGWSFVTHKEYDGSKDYHPKGIHGYDNMAEEMRAIFIAKGPLFDGNYKVGEPVAPFVNIEVYGLVTKALGLSPAPNNGTLDGVFVQQN